MNPVEVTEFVSSQKHEKNEAMLAWFLITRDPVVGFRLNLRFEAGVVDAIRESDPRGRQELLECVDRLVAEFKKYLGGAS